MTLFDVLFRLMSVFFNLTILEYIYSLLISECVTTRYDYSKPGVGKGVCQQNLRTLILK